MHACCQQSLLLALAVTVTKSFFSCVSAQLRVTCFSKPGAAAAAGVVQVLQDCAGSGLRIGGMVAQVSSKGGEALSSEGR